MSESDEEVLREGSVVYRGSIFVAYAALALSVFPIVSIFWPMAPFLDWQVSLPMSWVICVATFVGILARPSSEPKALSRLFTFLFVVLLLYSVGAVLGLVRQMPTSEWAQYTWGRWSILLGFAVAQCFVGIGLLILWMRGGISRGAFLLALVLCALMQVWSSPLSWANSPDALAMFEEQKARMNRMAALPVFDSQEEAWDSGVEEFAVVGSFGSVTYYFEDDDLELGEVTSSSFITIVETDSLNPWAVLVLLGVYSYLPIGRLRGDS